MVDAERLGERPTRGVSTAPTIALQCTLLACHHASHAVLGEPARSQEVAGSRMTGAAAGAAAAAPGGPASALGRWQAPPERPRVLQKSEAQVG